MINQKYKNAYKEILEILKFMPKDELSKIPEEKIEYFEKNKNADYNFVFDSSVSLEEQNISREAKAIILNLYNDYFLSDNQKEKLSDILKLNEKKYQEKQREKYNPNDIFKENKDTSSIQLDNEIVDNKNLPVEIESNNNIFKKIINKLRSLFTKNNKR